MSQLLKQQLLDMVSEDVGFYDITSEFTPEKKVRAEIIAYETGYVSGIVEISQLFTLFGIKTKKSLKEGDKIRKGQRVMLLEGNSRDILITKRTALNILSRMSGITTLTKKYLYEARKANPSIRVAATRKTTPLYRYFEKKAVKAGGGDTHRFTLSDAVLIKDNHLKLFRDVKTALRKAKEGSSFVHKIEIEVTNTRDAITAAREGADIIMLDNLLPNQIKNTILKLKKEKLRDRVIVEASGGITLDNIKAYAKTGVDVLSIGRLTHSIPVIDFSLKIL